jgi:uncharacterized protein
MGEPPSPPPGPLIVDGYGAGGFRISGQPYKGSILILRDRVAAWPVTDAAALTAADLALVTATSPVPEILLIGCGRRAALIAPALRQVLRSAGVVIDAMDTGAACRTYNVLLSEARRVAAALIAVD